VNLSILYFSKNIQLGTCVMVGETSKSIILNDLTLEELIYKIHYSCLDLQHFKKMKQENLTFELVDMKENIIDSDEAVKQTFVSNENSYKILWRPIINEKHKIIKNPLVVMIAISEYIDNTKWPNIPNVKDEDVKNFKQLFEEELKYQFVYNLSPRMTKVALQAFIDRLFVDFEIRTNEKKYDGLIIIICGHGENGNRLVTSDGKNMSIDDILKLFDCEKIESFKDFPKICIIDTCRNQNTSANYIMTAMRGKTEEKEDMQVPGHSHDGFLIIWSAIQGDQIANRSLLSNSMKSVVLSKYKSKYPLKQMLHDIRQDIQKSGNSEWYCMKTQDSTSYDMIFVARETL
ncbi:hypothetical protein RFI_32494, partial [Reticulomyxa filosa]